MISASIIVPAYNNAADITPLLDALNAQSFDPARAEYIIVDNNSRDATRAVVQAYAATARIALRCVDERSVQSSYAARNTGIRAAAGNILIFTDSDCTPSVDWVRQIVDQFDDPRVGIVGGGILAGEGNSLVEQYSSANNMLSQDYCINHRFKPYFQTANVAFRREVLDETGLFRPRLKTGGDADLCWRAQLETDYALRYCEAASVVHHHRSTLKGLHEQFARYGRSAVYLDMIHGSGIQAEPSYPYLLRKGLSYLVLRYPGLLLRQIRGQISAAAVYEEPLRLYMRWCRKKGMTEATETGLPSGMSIEYLGMQPSAAVSG